MPRTHAHNIDHKHPCVDSCGRRFYSERGLSIHQATCTHNNIFEASRMQDLAKRLEDAQEATRRADRKAQRHREKRHREKRNHTANPSEGNLDSLTGYGPIESMQVDHNSSSECVNEPIMLSEPSDLSPAPDSDTLGRGLRRKRPTWKVIEQQSATLRSLTNSYPERDPSPPPDPLPQFEPQMSSVDQYGLYCRYLSSVPTPSRTQFIPTPIHFVIPASRVPMSLQQRAIRAAPSQPLPPTSAVSDVTELPLDGCSNISSRLIMGYHWSKSTKSLDDLNYLVHQVIRNALMDPDSLADFNAYKETRLVDAAIAMRADGWRESTVQIEVPDGKPHVPGSNIPVPIFPVPGLVHRSIIEIIKTVWSSQDSQHFQFVPFRQFWTRTPSGNEEQVLGELYTSEAFNTAYEELQNQPPEPGCTLERIICALMLYSDSTHLANFGDAALWPLYLFFGNQSKYTRACPSSGSCHHVAYIPKLPDTFHDFYLKLTGEGPPSDILTHCRRELMHGVLQLVMDDNFVYACKHGIIVTCWDGVERRIFPQIFTYSADYPEKALLATIRNLGKCPCPRCKLPRDRIADIGTIHDQTRRQNLARQDDHPRRVHVQAARAAIYEQGKGVKSSAVEGRLSESSYVPTANAFSECLGDLLNLFLLFVVDLMHEIELGVWKALFIHLIRILIAVGGTAIQNLNERFRQVPTFGRATIRTFHNNVSSMKKLAARDYEDQLQCCLPVLEGLFPVPAQDRAIQDLVFILAEWHANAKLRLHTTSTLDILEKLTREFGIRIRHFANRICPDYDTRELPKEEAARIRRRAKKQSNSNTPAASTIATQVKRKLFSLTTYKLHAMGDYVSQIKMFGTTDSYSTQAGELEHRSVKRYYTRTNKINPTLQIARIHRRERILKRIAHAHEHKERVTAVKKRQGRSDTPRPKSIYDHHFISASRNFPENIAHWNEERRNDPQYKDFFDKLLNHLVGRIRHPDIADDGTLYGLDEQSEIRIVGGRMYSHKTLQVNYTTYDMRREYDIINPTKHANIMTASSDLDVTTGTSPTGHPFAYARVLGIFHADVVRIGTGHAVSTHTVQFLHVHWYCRDTHFKAGFKHRRLHCISLLPPDDPHAFGFLDPDDVIRGCHIIPGFTYGNCAASSVDDFLPTTLRWKFFYVNFFVDRDMYMRYRGGGVGHVALEVTEPDRDVRDEVLEEDGNMDQADSEAPDVDEDEDEMEGGDEEDDGSEDGDDDIDMDDDDDQGEENGIDEDDQVHSLQTSDLIHGDLGYSAL